jgi:LysR family cys regulon transcriptional activator
VLPVPVARLREAYPKVNVSLHQGSPDQVARMLIDEVAEIGIATESLSDYAGAGHPALLRVAARAGDAAGPFAGQAKERVSLEDLAAEPIITYHPSFTGRTRIDAAFAQQKLHAAHRARGDRLGRDQDLRAPRAGRGHRRRDGGARRRAECRPRGAPLGHVFGQNIARVAFKRSAYLRNFVFKFAELLSDRLDRNLIAKALSGHQQDYEL